MHPAESSSVPTHELCISQAVVCGTALMIITLIVEITLFLIGAIRVDSTVLKREQRASRGVMDRTKLGM